MNGLKAWWRMRSPREQRMVAIMVGLLALVIAWLGIIRPLDDALADARARQARAVLALADARGQAQAIRALERGGTPPPPSVPVQIFVAQRASEAGFTVARLEPEGANKVNVVIDAARPQAIFSWAADLERRDGLVVERMTARANADASLSVQIAFRARGG